MGKIYDVLEMKKREMPKPLVPVDPEASLAKKISKRHEWSQELVVLSDPGSVDAENFKILRGKILFSSTISSLTGLRICTCGVRPNSDSAI